MSTVKWRGFFNGKILIFQQVCPKVDRSVNVAGSCPVRSKRRIGQRLTCFFPVLNYVEFKPTRVKRGCPRTGHKIKKMLRIYFFFFVKVIQPYVLKCHTTLRKFIKLNLYFRRTTVQEETHVQRDGADVDHQTDQDQSDVPVASADRRHCSQEDIAQSAPVLVPAACPPVQTVHVLSSSRLQVPSLPPSQGTRAPPSVRASV